MDKNNQILLFDWHGHIARGLAYKSLFPVPLYFPSVTHLPNAKPCVQQSSIPERSRSQSWNLNPSLLVVPNVTCHASNALPSTVDANTRRRLNLAHGWAPPSTNPTAQVNIPALLQRREHRRHGISRKAEPQKRSARLRLVAAFPRVMRAVGDRVARRVLCVAAAVHAQVRGGGDAADEEKQRVEQVEHDHDERVEGELFLEGGGDEVEEREHREHGCEHVVVYDGGVAADGVGDHVAHQRYDQERPEELQVLVRGTGCRRSGVAKRYLQASHSEVDWFCDHCA